MMITYAWFIAVVLGGVSLLHFAWAFGVIWPGKTEQEMLNTVVGAPEATRMPPPWITFIVAIGIGLAGVIALWGAGAISLPLPQWIRSTGLIVLSVIFIVRGIATFLPFGPLHRAINPFRTLDLRYFAPLILIIGIGYVLLAMQQWGP